MIHLILLLILIGVLLALMEQLPIDATVKRIIWIVVIVCVIMWLLSIFLPYDELPPLPWHGRR